jgi:hypothetical protein
MRFLSSAHLRTLNMQLDAGENMTIDSIAKAITAQIAINNFLASHGIKDLVGGYGQLLLQKSIGGEPMSATNQGFDILHFEYNRIEVKTRKYERKLDGGITKETRAVGFDGKENGFDWMAHIILDTEYRVVGGVLAKYSEVWPELMRNSKKISFSASAILPSSINITAELKNSEIELAHTSPANTVRIARVGSISTA